MSSAILSADDLNDFISPGVACIKPVETLPAQADYDPYEVTTEDKLAAANPVPASISLTDCLACSGCVTSAEAVLVSLQSHAEVLDTLERTTNIDVQRLKEARESYSIPENGRVFVASISPQVRASIAATYGISQRRAGNLIAQLLSGPGGLAGTGTGTHFQYIIDTNVMRSVCLDLAADEVQQSISNPSQKQPIITSACPGWICYAEKTHPHILPHLSQLKSPQALSGTLVKSVLSRRLGISPAQIWHLAIMPCFDKKLEASRAELTSSTWHGLSEPVRDVDCVITSRELLSLASARNIALHRLPTTPGHSSSFPDPLIDAFLRQTPSAQTRPSNTSGGYLAFVLSHFQRQNPGSTVTTTPGRNSDVSEYTLFSSTGTPLLRCARYYGFRNIQNLVRKLKPNTNRRKAGTGSEYAYVEVMACPGGCTNGGGQIRVQDAVVDEAVDVSNPKEWLARVDEAYFSADSDEDHTDVLETNNQKHSHVPWQSSVTTAALLSHWSDLVAVPLDKLVYTTFRAVESDVGKPKSDGANIAKIAGLEGGGW